jgi:hypothetical protein
MRCARNSHGLLAWCNSVQYPVPVLVPVRIRILCYVVRLCAKRHNNLPFIINHLCGSVRLWAWPCIIGIRES